MEPQSIRKLIRPDLLDLKPYSSARDEFSDDRKGKVFLDANENPADSGLNRYPDPHQREVKRQLARIKKVDVSEIFLGNGSDEVLDLLFRAFCVAGQDNCIVLPPTYGMYGVLAALNGVEVRKVPMNSDFQPDVEAVLARCDQRSKILFICSPNNPSGNLIERDRIEALLEHFPGLVVIDEAYWEYSGAPSWIEEKSAYPNLVVTQTFSKAHGLAGIRLGSCYAHPTVVAVLNRIKPPYNVNELTQQNALSRLGKEDYIKNVIALNKEEKKKLIEQLVHIKYVKRVFPSDANFLLVQVDDADLRYRQLLERGVVVRNRNNQPLCENCLRITVGTAEQNEILIDILKDL